MITGTRNMQLNIILSIFALTLIPACYGVEAECKTTTKGREYTGILSVTEHGLQCQRWDAKTPHHPVPSIIAISNFPPGTGTLDKAENYCRNPDSDARPWCYTMDPKVKYQFCDIPFCPETTTPKSTTTSTTQSPTTPPEEQSNVCVCKGDPHCFRFDDEKYNKDQELFITDSCGYTMVTDSCSNRDSVPEFVISAVFERVSMDLIRSYVKELHISNNGNGLFESYQLKQGMEVIHDGSTLDLTNTPLSYPGTSTIEVVATTDQVPNDWDVQGSLVKIDFVNGYRVLWDGVKMFKIIAPDSASGNICGLCGNFDAERPNDMRTGNHNIWNESDCRRKVVTHSFQSTVTDQQTLIDSWLSEKVSSSEACVAECGSPVP